MKNEKKLTNCKVCGAEIAKNAKSCPACGAKNKKPPYKKVWFWILMFILFTGFIGSLGSNNSSTTDTSSQQVISNTNNTSSQQNASANKTTPSEFDGDCGISASAEMASSIIGFPELTISVTNTSSKDIAAIQFYAVPLDVYGDEIKGWTTQTNLYTDTKIPAGQSDSFSYQLIEESVKTVKLYAYSVYFTDGTEWGNKDATPSTILKNGAIIEVSGES